MCEWMVDGQRHGYMISGRMVMNGWMEGWIKDELMDEWLDRYMVG